jgi:hypothetical protein
VTTPTVFLLFCVCCRATSGKTGYNSIFTKLNESFPGSSIGAEFGVDPRHTGSNRSTLCTARSAKAVKREWDQDQPIVVGSPLVLVIGSPLVLEAVGSLG